MFLGRRSSGLGWKIGSLRKNLADVHFAQAENIILVQDNLNTHAAASLYEAFPAAEARAWSNASNGIMSWTPDLGPLAKV